MTKRARKGQIAGIAALNEPARGALYDYVVARGGAVSRDQAAAGTGVSRALAAFHLDRLVDAGLLVVAYRRLTGKTGPGAGRPSKLYSRSPGQVAISLPPRSYGLAAELFAEALDADSAHRALPKVARAFGKRLADAGAGRAAALMATLESLGYEPVRRANGEVRLRNCPFHALTERHKALVCGTNLALLDGFVSALRGGGRDFEAALDPQPGMCCVVLRPARSRSGARRPGRGRSR